MTRRVLLAVSGPDEVRIVHGLAQLAEGDLQVVRRCADLAEVLAAAAAGIADLALVDLELRGLDASAVAALEQHGVAAVGYVSDPEHSRRTALPGAAGLVDGSDSVAAVAGVLRRAGRPSPDDERSADPAEASAHPGAVAPVGPPGSEPVPPSVTPDARSARGAVRPPAPGTGSGSAAGSEPGAGAPELPGITALWAPGGSPGRSTLAVTLATVLAARGQEQILVDADTWGASLAQMLGVLDESPGLVLACRSAANGDLDRRRLDGMLPTALRGVALLAAPTAPSRWAEIGETELGAVLDAARETGRHVLVDVASPLEQDEEAAFDTFAPRRNGASLTSLATADRVLAVTRADPIGLARLLRSWDELRAIVDAPVSVVLSQVRGASEEREIRGLLERSLPEVAVYAVPADDGAVARALWDGATMTERAPRSPLLAAAGRLADALGVPARTGRRRR